MWEEHHPSRSLSCTGMPHASLFEIGAALRDAVISLANEESSRNVMRVAQQQATTDHYLRLCSAPRGQDRNSMDWFSHLVVRNFMTFKAYATKGNKSRLGSVDKALREEDQHEDTVKGIPVLRVHLQRYEMDIFNMFGQLNGEPTVISTDDAKLHTTTQDSALASLMSLEPLPSLVLQMQYDKHAVRSETPRSLGYGGQRDVKEDRQDGGPGLGKISPGGKATKRLINVNGLVPGRRESRR
ncbi:hypothetical protein ACHAPO_006536 [Fusarium lateritium]